MVVLIVLFGTQAHDAQDAGDGAFTWCEDRADEQDLSVLPNTI